MSYQEFVRLVRRLRRSDLLVALAQISAHAVRESQKPDFDRDRPPDYHQWALAGIARAALCYGNDHREGRPSLQDIKRLSSAFVNIHDPFIEDRDVGSLMVRIAHEQFQFQQPDFHGLARTQALLVDTAESAGSTVITPAFWHSLLGCSLRDLFAVALMAHTMAAKSGGELNLGSLDTLEFAPVFEFVSRETTKSILRSLFIDTVDAHRQTVKEVAAVDEVKGDLERYSFNPLKVHPFVLINERRAVAPVVPFVFHRAMPGSLYFPAIRKHGPAFSNELGRLFEIYVGAQLGLLRGVVNPEIKYEVGGESFLSVDFFFITRKLVVLVEAKATPMRADGRRGGPTLGLDLKRGPGEAVAQIERSARLIREGHPSFSAIPSDRPVVGLVVTLEPYYAVSWPSPEVPTWTASVEDLEHVVRCQTHGLDDLLVPHPTPQATYPLTGRLQDLSFDGRNAILDGAYSKLPFNGEGGSRSAGS